MHRTNSDKLLLSAGLIFLMSCTNAITARRVKLQEDLRYRGAADESFMSYEPDSKLFRIAVVDFVDQTHNTAGKVEDMFADVMTTSLYRTSRFTLFDRSQLKRKNVTSERTVTSAPAPGTVPNSLPGTTPAAPLSTATYQEADRVDDSHQAEEQMQRLADEMDGVFVGFITNAEQDDANHGSYTIDYRIVKRVKAQRAWSKTEEVPTGRKHGIGMTAESVQDPEASAKGEEASMLVIFADSATVHFNGNPMQKDQKETKPVTLKREDLEAIAKKVAEFFPKLAAPEYSAARVTDVNGRTVTINLGTKEVKPGYSFFVTTPPDDATGEFFFKAKFVVLDTFEKASRAELSAGLPEQLMKSIKPQDRVLMK